jgi:surfactin synthase thioesterase subunit
MHRRQAKLIMLPFAGGGRQAYRPLEAHLADCVMMLPVELPGRGARFREPPLTEMDEMVRDALHKVRPSLTGPYALFGHSLGAVVAYHMTQRIVRSSLPPPVHLFVSGSRPPWVHAESIGHLPDSAFLRRLREKGGMADEAADNEELMELMLPVLRADVRAGEIRCHPPTEPVDVPMSILCGSDDEAACSRGSEWAMASSRPSRTYELPGGHFFIFDVPDRVGCIISETLEPTLRGS